MNLHVKKLADADVENRCFEEWPDSAQFGEIVFIWMCGCNVIVYLKPPDLSIQLAASVTELHSFMSMTISHLSKPQDSYNARNTNTKTVGCVLKDFPQKRFIKASAVYCVADASVANEPMNIKSPFI